MRIRNVKTSFPSRRGLRLMTGALALSFSLLTSFPFLHIALEHCRPAAACMEHPDQTRGADAGPAYAPHRLCVSESCWGCQFVSQLQHAGFSPDTPRASTPCATPHAGGAPETPALVKILTANRSQAPPARA